MSAQAGWDQIAELTGKLRLPRAYCPVEPNLKQEWFLRQDVLEAFYGGSAGPGKSWGLLMAAIQYVDVPGYNALLLRPTLGEFEMPGGLIEVSHQWLDTTDAYWNGSKREWRFPSGAALRFGYLATAGDIKVYKGPSYSFCGFDELTSFPERLYRAMFRVLRQPVGGHLENVPVRMRSASNPGDLGHSWVKSRFIDPLSRAEGAVFVRATIRDNPHLDYVEYLKTLAHLDPVERARLIDGDWDVSEEGGKFDRSKLRIIEADEVAPSVKAVRYWDLAGSEVSVTNSDPDWTVGLRLDLDRAGVFTIRHIVRGRWDDAVVQKTVRQTADADGHSIPVFVEQDPGQAGKAQLAHYKRFVLQGYPVHAGLTRVNGKNASKEVRARPVAAAVGNELVQIVRSEHLLEALDELSIFPQGSHDDIVDALSGAYTALTQRGSQPGRARISTAVGYRIPGVNPDGTQDYRF